MNKLVLIAAAATLLFGGCASTSKQYAGYDDIDTQRVAAIDRLARRRGVEVHWINYPQRKGIVSDPAAPIGT